MRKSDSSETRHFRSADRVFRVDDAWFVETREGDLGPFPTREEASLRLKRFIGEQESFASAKAKVEKVRSERTSNVDTGIWDKQIGID